MMVQRRRLAKGVSSVQYERVVCADVDGRRGPCAVDADCAAREEAVWVDVLNYGLRVRRDEIQININEVESTSRVK